MSSQGDECTFGELPANVFKQGSFGISTPQTLPSSPSPSRSLGPPIGLNLTNKPWGAVSRSVSPAPLTPQTLQDRSADLALKVDGVPRETNDAQSRLATQDARLGDMQPGLKTDSAMPSRSQKMDQLRQHVTDLRTIVMQDGGRVPGALQHVQRMLRLLAGQAQAVHGDDGGRTNDVLMSIDVLSSEVSQLIDLEAKGNRKEGEVMSTSSMTTSPVVTPGRSVLVGTPPIVTGSSSPRIFSRLGDAGELADLRTKVSALTAQCERAECEAARARVEVSEIHSKLVSIQRALDANLAVSLNTKSADYRDELAACSSQRSPKGEVLDAGIREQMHILDHRLKEAEDRLQRITTRPETLLVSKELVQSLRQEVLKDVEDLRIKVQSQMSPRGGTMSPLSNLGQAEVGQLVSIGLTQLREVGALAGVLNLPSIIAASQGAAAPAVLATQVQDFGNEVARLADNSRDNEKNIKLLFDDVKKMKESIDLRAKNPPVALPSTLASTLESSSSSPAKSDFAALFNSKLAPKHLLPQ